MRELEPARVRVPCSTSNLGSGFDCIGLALDRYLEVSFEPGGTGVRLERTGTLAGLPVDPEGDAVVAAFRAALDVSAGGTVHGVFRMDSSIPVARGLGSSAAATVAGLTLAAAAAAREPRQADDLLELAARLEGHPDNSAPSIRGGLVAIVRTPAGGHRAFRLPLSDSLGFAFAAPPVEVSTAEARRALPADVPRAVAVRALGRVAALVHGLETGEPDLLRAGFDDELHVPWRLPLIPQADAASEAARAAGAIAVTISGSGSGLIAVAPRGAESAVADAMGGVFARVGPTAVSMALQPDPDGARVLELEVE